MRISLVNLAMESVQEVEQALSGQGYEITADRSLTVDEILALSPEVLVTEVTPSDMPRSCPPECARPSRRGHDRW